MHILKNAAIGLVLVISIGEQPTSAGPAVENGSMNWVRAVISSTFQNFALSELTPSSGSLKEHENTYRFELGEVLTFSCNGTQRNVVTIQFPELAKLRTSSELVSTQIAPEELYDGLIVADKVLPANHVYIPFDSESAGTEQVVIDSGDFAGIGEPQIRADFTAVSLDREQPGIHIAKMVLLINGCSGSRMLYIPLYDHFTGNSGLSESARGSLTFENRNGSGPKTAILTFPTLNLSQTADLIDGKYVFGDVAPDAKVRQIAPAKKHDYLRVKVIDENGTPLSGVSVSGYSTFTSLLTMKTTTNKIATTTNASGECNPAHVGMGVFITFSKDGFYTVKRDWSEKLDSTEPQIVTLVHAMPEVEMVASKFDFRNTVGELHVEFGCPLLRDSSELGRCTPSTVGADIWVQLTRKFPRTTGGDETQNHEDPAAWEIEIQGLNGWQLAMGPDSGVSGEEAEMHIAPVSGYVNSLKFSGAQLPLGLFLQKDGGKKYGKVFGLSLQLDDRPKYMKTRLRFQSSIQRSEVGSRSLNPKSR